MAVDDPPSDPRAVVRPAGDLLEGTPYRLLSPLDKGGMGEVFEAEHRALGHRVVIKILRDAFAERPDMRDRMRVEGQALARIRHPNLVMVTDFGETRTGHQFIVMERLVGAPLLDRLLREGFVPIAQALEIARQMLLGLSAAHEAGLVHRDVKPGNVFLCATEDRERPLVKLLDFGVVKIAQVGRDPRTPLPLVVATAEGVMLGTPRYFSPEQARRESDLDERSDLYSVGLVLYEMLAGLHPFEHHTDVDAVSRAHAYEVPLPPSVHRSQRISSEIDRLVMRSLAKPREERFQSAVAFADEIARRLVDLGADPIAAPRPLFAGVPDAKSFAEAETSPAIEMGAHKKPLDPFAARRLSDAPVMIDHLVERVLGQGVERAPSPTSFAPTYPVPAPSPISPSPPDLAPAPSPPDLGGIGTTAPMIDPSLVPVAPPVEDKGVGTTAPMVDPSLVPVAPPVEDKGVGTTAPMVDPSLVPVAPPAENKGVGTTAPMLEVASSVRPPPPPLNAGLPMPSSPAPTNLAPRPAWLLPVVLAVGLTLIAGLLLAILLVLR